MLKQKLVVLSAQQYSIVDKATGEASEGTTVRYALSENLDPTEDKQLKGYKLGKTSLPLNNFIDFTEVPAIYTADMDMNIAADGTVKVKAINFRYDSPLFPIKK